VMIQRYFNDAFNNDGRDGFNIKIAGLFRP